MTDPSGLGAGVWIVVGIAALEMILSLTWNRIYFSIGIPIFRRELEAPRPGPAIPTPEALEKAMETSESLSLEFRRIGEYRFGFRQSPWNAPPRRQYTPVMHGSLEFEPAQARVRVTGFANLYAPAFLAWFIVTWVRIETFYFLVVLAIIYGGVYALQAKRFGSVARAAAILWMAGR